MISEQFWADVRALGKNVEVHKNSKAWNADHAKNNKTYN